jgi:signal transduction histidine kinase
MFFGFCVFLSCLFSRFKYAERDVFRLSDLVADTHVYSDPARQKMLSYYERYEVQYAGHVYGDVPRLRQVLGNLLSNAIKFTKEGYISLSAKQVAETDTTVSVAFEVEDSGVGIKHDAMPRLFRPFHQADPSTFREFGGSGLGLCIVKQVGLPPVMNRVRRFALPF